MRQQMCQIDILPAKALPRSRGDHGAAEGSALPHIAPPQSWPGVVTAFRAVSVVSLAKGKGEKGDT
jgi:hypothetical protein